MIVSDAHFLSCFTDAKTTTKWKKLINWWQWAAHSPQTYWSLRIDVNPCDTALLPHHQPIRDLCASWSHALGCPSLTPLTFKNALLERFRELGSFWAEASNILVQLASLDIGHMNFPLITKEDWKVFPLFGRSPWRRKWQPTLVFLPGESHGRRSLVGYSPRGRKESDTTERLHFHFH